MAGLSFNFFFFIGIILYIQLEFFFFLCYTNVIFFTKQLQLTKTLKTHTVATTATSNSFFYLFLFFFIFFKSSESLPYLWLFYMGLFIFILEKLMSYFTNWQKSTTNFFASMLPLLCGFLFFILTINSFLTFFFFLELYGVLYYFAFLTTYTHSNQTFLKYKNGVLLLLWNNFLTTFFLGLGCFFILKTYGTTNFLELNYITHSSNYIYVYLIGVFWKIGLPIFHFFKIEIYKILLKENVFLFSIITTLVNLFLVYFLLSQFVVFNTIYFLNWFVLILLFLLNLILLNLKLHNILYYFAISSILTSTTVIVVFLF